MKVREASKKKRDAKANFLKNIVWIGNQIETIPLSDCSADVPTATEEQRLHQSAIHFLIVQLLVMFLHHFLFDAKLPHAGCN